MISKHEPERKTNTQPAVEYLTRKEAANFLRISLAKLDQITDMERIRYGRSVRFSINMLRGYAEKHTIRGTEYV